MPYAQRDEEGNIIGLYKQPQPDLVPPATEWVPEGTTLTETDMARVEREFDEIVAMLPAKEQEAVELYRDQIMTCLIEGNPTNACAIVESIGVLPTLSNGSKQRIKSKLMELPPV